MPTKTGYQIHFHCIDGGPAIDGPKIPLENLREAQELIEGWAKSGYITYDLGECSYVVLTTPQLYAVISPTFSEEV